MLTVLLQLIILFLVIFDPPASLAVFLAGTQSMKHKARERVATMAILVASGLSLFVLILGPSFFWIFHASADEFRVAGGIVLGILGVKMVLGHPLTYIDKFKNDQGRAIAAIIGTPILTGPAAITTIILSVQDYGRILTAFALLVVLVLTALLFYMGNHARKFMTRTAITVLSTMLGLITLAWSVKYISVGIAGII